MRRCHDKDCHGHAEHGADKTENWEETATDALTTAASGSGPRRDPAPDGIRLSTTSVGRRLDTSTLVPVGIRVPPFARRPASELVAAIARLIGSPGRSVRGCWLTVLHDQAGEARLGEGVASLLRVAVGSLAAGEIASLVEHPAEPERPLSIASLVRSPVSGEGTLEVSLFLEQHSQLGRTSPIAAFVGATEGSDGAGKIALRGEYVREVEGSVRVASLVRARVGGEGTLEVFLVLEQNSQIGRTGRIAAFVGATEGSDGAGKIALRGEYVGEVEGSVRVASLVRPRVGGEGALKVSLFLEQNSQIARTGRIAEIVGTTEGSDRTGRITLRGKQPAEVEGRPGATALVGAPVHRFALDRTVLLVESFPGKWCRRGLGAQRAAVRRLLVSLRRRELDNCLPRHGQFVLARPRAINQLPYVLCSSTSGKVEESGKARLEHPCHRSPVRPAPLTPPGPARFSTRWACVHPARVQLSRPNGPKT